MCPSSLAATAPPPATPSGHSWPATSASSTASRSWPTRALREALLRGERAGHLVTDEVLDAVAIAGTPGECRRALARWAEAGLDTVIAVVPRETDMLEQLALIGAELSPHWKEIRCR